MNPKISVIIPVYNTEQYLKECLDSVVNQTLKDIEIIIINDASPDNSISIINDYASNDGRIVVIDKKNNEGVGQARNDGILKATGEFIAFMDSDDLYSSTVALEHLYDAAVKQSVEIVGGMREDLTDKVLLKEYPIEEYGLNFNQSEKMNYRDFQYDYGYWQYIYNRDMLIRKGILFPNYSRFQDPPFFVKAMNCAKDYYFINEPVYRYRLLSSASKYTIKKTLDMLDGIIDNLHFSRENRLSKLHCLSAHRLNKEGSYMAIQNLYCEDNYRLLSKLIEASTCVDTKWLKECGYELEEPFVLDVFKYAVETAEKYEKLRNNKFAKTIRKLKPRR